MTFSTKLSLLALCALLASCSALQPEKINYQSAAKAPALDIPPDLTQLSRDTRYVVPGSAITASGYQASAGTTGLPVAAAAIADMRIEKAGNQRWLVVDRPADKLWEPLRDFWQENGFLLTIDQASLGIMETDWAENRAKLPQDFIRSTLGKVLESFYSTGERDKFRTRLERTASGGTEIYISHRGLVEIITNKQEQNGSMWQPRPADPELEAEFLRKLMVRLGVSAAQAKALPHGVEAKTVARVVTSNNLPAVQVDENFDRAWRRVGLALDRTGFTVEDRDRSQGIYFVRYVDPAEKKEQGFFSRLFSGSSAPQGPLKYRIVLRGEADKTLVSVMNASGAPESSTNAQRIVQLIADDIK